MKIGVRNSRLRPCDTAPALRKPKDERKMQNKKPFLRRLLIIYVALFLVLVAGLTLEILPGFSRGYDEGAEIGTDIAASWLSDNPRMIYMLENIPIADGPHNAVTATTADSDTRIDTRIRRIGMTVEEDAPGASMLALAFRSLGGRGWIYATVILCMFAYLTVIVLMFLILHSVRRSIREERTLDKRNVWYLRAIGGLAIATELLNDLVNRAMNLRAAELLAGSGYTVDTAFHVSYSTIVMGLLIVFAAEVFAIGQNLSEEQKLTI